MNNIELLRLAKELTGSCSIKELMAHALELKKFVDVKEPKKFIPENLKYAYMDHISGSIIGMSPDDYKMVDEDFYTTNYKALYTSRRQKGLSTYIAFKSIQEAIFNENYSIVLVSHNRESISNLMEKLYYIIEYHENASALPDIVTCNKKQITFSNGSKIYARVCSADAIRGLDPDIILIDNFSYISYSTLNDFLKSVYPLLSTKKSKILGFSTGCEKSEIINIETY